MEDGGEQVGSDEEGVGGRFAVLGYFAFSVDLGGYVGDKRGVSGAYFIGIVLGGVDDGLKVDVEAEEGGASVVWFEPWFDELK